MIRVLCADISAVDESGYQALYAKATPRRRSKADACKFFADAVRCVAGDALLRHALGTHAYTTEEGPAGKPRICGRPDFQFNLSHSGPWVVLAYGVTEVGVDVEMIRRKRDPQKVARRFFSPEELAYVLAEDALIPERFCEVWTGKESYIKYLGVGLGMDLTSFSILSPDPGLRYFFHRLSKNCCLTLCTEEGEHELIFVDPMSL